MVAGRGWFVGAGGGIGFLPWEILNKTSKKSGTVISTVGRNLVCSECLQGGSSLASLRDDKGAVGMKVFGSGYAGLGYFQSIIYPAKLIRGIEDKHTKKAEIRVPFISFNLR